MLNFQNTTNFKKIFRETINLKQKIFKKRINQNDYLSNYFIQN